MKTCSKCGKDKPLSAFYRRRSDCNACKAAYQKHWTSRNKEYCSRKQKEYKAANKQRFAEAYRRKNLRANYGMSESDYHDMLAEQGGCCAICGAAKAGGRGAFHVDHCHDTGLVRGLLCSNCNTGLGKFRDNPDLLAEAITYLLNGTQFTPGGPYIEAGLSLAN